MTHAWQCCSARNPLGAAMTDSTSHDAAIEALAAELNALVDQAGPVVEALRAAILRKQTPETEEACDES